MIERRRATLERWLPRPCSADHRLVVRTGQRHQSRHREARAEPGDSESASEAVRRKIITCGGRAPLKGSPETVGRQRTHLANKHPAQSRGGHASARPPIGRRRGDTDAAPPSVPVEYHWAATGHSWRCSLGMYTVQSLRSTCSRRICTSSLRRMTVERRTRMIARSLTSLNVEPAHTASNLSMSSGLGTGVWRANAWPSGRCRTRTDDLHGVNVAL